MARRAQDWSPLLVLLYNLALATQAQGDLAGAAAHLQEGLALAGQACDETSAASYLEVLAGIAGQQDNPQRAVRLFAAARSILDASGSGWLHGFVPLVPHDDAVLAALRSQYGRRGIPGGPGVGPVRREQTRGGLRTPASVTCRGPGRFLRPLQAAAVQASESGTGQDAGRGRQAAGPVRADLGQARETADRWVRRGGHAGLGRAVQHSKAEMAAGGDACPARQV